MSAFFSDLLEEFLTPVFLNEVCEKYHYGETQVTELLAVAKEMLVPMCREAFWKGSGIFADGFLAGGHDVGYEKVVMSLGNGLDFLQESYDQKGMLLQSYMLEVLAGELLMRGYDAYNRYTRGHTGWHVARYHFPGSEEAFPLEVLPELLKGLTQQVSCNQAFCMVPKKSVAFIAELTRDEQVQCEGVCAGCGNMRCPNRTVQDGRVQKRIKASVDMPLTYGYGRIFGLI